MFVIVIGLILFILGNLFIIIMYRKDLDPNKSKLVYLLQCISVIFVLSGGGAIVYEILDRIGIYGNVSWIPLVAIVLVEYIIYLLFIKKRDKVDPKIRALAEEMARQQMMDNIIQKRIVDYDYDTLVKAIEKRLLEEENN